MREKAQLFYQNSLGVKGEIKDSVARRSENTRISQTVVTLTALTCGRPRDPKKPVLVVLSLVLET